MRDCYLGLDAGGSKTVALVADATGRVLGRGRGGPGDVYSAPDAEGEVVGAVHAALADAGVGASRVRHAALRLAGVDWPEDRTHWEDAVAARLPGLASTSVADDGLALLRCAGADGVGLAVTAGTGPAVAARGPSGEEFSACWWIQHPLGGRALGRAAMVAVVDAELGAGPATALTVELLALHGHPDVEPLLHAATRRVPTGPVPDERAAARCVLRAAGSGDVVAAAVVAEQARTFARLGAVAVARTGLAGLGAVRCVLGGSLLTSEHPALRDALAAALQAELGPVQVVASAASPVAGALLDALAEAGVLDGAARERVLASEHPAAFLLT